MQFRSLLAMLVSACALPAMSHAEDGVFDSKGVKIHYVTEGKGEAVVLIHGWMSDSTMWGRDAKGNTKLDTTDSEGFQVIAMDCRGHGKSDKPHDPKQYGEEMANDVVRLLDHLKIKKAHLVGYSMGAFIAGKVAATHPGRVLSIIYGGQAPLISGTRSTGPSEVDIFAKAVEEGKGLGPYIIAISPDDRPKPSLEQANSYAKYVYRGKDVKAFAVAGQSLKYLGVKMDDLKRCKAPALFLYGSKEPDSLKERVAAFQKVLVTCEVKAIEGADHITALWNPEFGKSLTGFLKAHKKN